MLCRKYCWRRLILVALWWHDCAGWGRKYSEGYGIILSRVILPVFVETDSRVFESVAATSRLSPCRIDGFLR
jgi:hypothetical protein